MVKKLLLCLLTIITIMSSVYACFDTYLFLNRRSMVYPEKHLIVDTLAEYSANSMTNPAEDTYLMNFNGYYGVAERFSLQLGASSSEKLRNQVAIDEYGLKLVYNILNMKEKMYYMDAIIWACRSTAGGDVAFEISAPNILYLKDNLLVIHPVIELPHNNPAIIGGHFGLFRLFNDVALIGIGAEYASAQSGSTFNKRLVEGEAAASIFLGAKLGDIFYFQNELAKGLANSRDFGFALTLKIFVN